MTQTFRDGTLGSEDAVCPLPRKRRVKLSAYQRFPVRGGSSLDRSLCHPSAKEVASLLNGYILPTLANRGGQATVS